MQLLHRRLCPARRGIAVSHLIAAACIFPALFSTAQKGSAQDVPPVDFSTISPADFADDELDLPYYLAHFHTLANSVRMTEPNRGFIDLPVWRGVHEQQPYNARIMENVLALAFFYVTDRPWNPYFDHPAVRVRLEAALSFWLELQNDEGLFSETEQGVGQISPTGFATKFFGETLRLLNDGPQIDPQLLEDVAQADRQAIEAFLASDEFFEHGIRYSNHYTNIWGGALAYLDIYPDDELEELLARRLEQGLAAFQSPAGFFYERRGPDWVYEIETHHSNHLIAWHYLRNTDFADAYALAIERWYDWLAYNTALEPDTSGFVINHSIEARLTFSFYEENRITSFGRTCLPVAREVVLARAFCESEEERMLRLAEDRSELEQSWPEVPALRLGEFYGYSPYAFLHRNHVRWHPTSRQKAEARRQLPSRRSQELVHQRADDLASLAVSFIRQPRYYAAFNVGEQTDRNQQFGLGIVWTPDEGAVVQAQKIDEMAWGTRASGVEETYEAEIIDAQFDLDGTAVELEPGSRDLGSGTLTISYGLGERGRKQVSFLPNQIVVSIQHTGPFVESIPLLIGPTRHIEIATGVVRVTPELEITVGENATASVRRANRRIGRKQIQMLEIQANGSLQYRLEF